MGISERREREKVERRRNILKCARELILLHGVHQVSMENIALKAELSKATVYLYFPSKNVLFNEICEEAAQVFLERLKPLLETGTGGIEALKCFWRGYVELFGSFDEMIIISQIRNFVSPGLPMVSSEERQNSSHVDAIIGTMRGIIEQCKTEGVFDPNLDINMATRLLLSLFSVNVETASRLPPEARKSPAVIEEMQNTFQIILRGFARDGIDRNCLDIRN
jgi:AcrR family transcriptional regulator